MDDDRDFIPDLKRYPFSYALIKVWDEDSRRRKAALDATDEGERTRRPPSIGHSGDGIGRESAFSHI